MNVCRSSLLPINNCLINEKTSDIQSKKFWPRWSTPVSTTTTALEDMYNRKSDQEHSIGPMADNKTNKKQALISLCKSLMLYGAPCHRIVSD